jgi:hypothetical protein
VRALAAAFLLAIASGLFFLAAPAHADAVIQVADSADPVTVNTPYTYTVTVPVISQPDYTFTLNIGGGPAATITNATLSDPSASCVPLNPTFFSCGSNNSSAASLQATFTVLPTATGTISARANYSTGGGGVTGSDSEDTTITAPASADIGVNLGAQPHLGILVPYLRYTATLTNNGPGAVTAATLTATLPSGKTATNLSSGCTSTPGQVTCTYGAIANGANAVSTFNLPIGLLNIGQVNVTATRTASTPADNNAANDSDTATCTVVSVVLATCP